MVNRASAGPGRAPERREPKNYLEEQAYKRMEAFKRKKEQWSNWSFVFKATTRSACHAAFQILGWVER